MNPFLQSVHNQINRHGLEIVFVVETTSGRDPITGKVVKTRTEKTVKSYPKHIMANQYQYPNLIGKDVVMFLIPGDMLDQGYLNAKIEYKGKSYDITSYQETVARGEVVLYRVVAVKA